MIRHLLVVKNNIKICGCFSLLLLLFSCYSKSPETTGLEGKPMPDFNLLLIDSSRLNTRQLKNGKPIVLYYFGPHCPYSKTQMEEIITDMSILKNIQFLVFTSWPFDEMKKFYNHFQLTKYSNIITGVDEMGFFRNYYEVPGVPYMAIFGKDKKLKRAFVGNIYSKQIISVTKDE
jgi:thiol-disulfide isomerase/thioredoxin